LAKPLQEFVQQVLGEHGRGEKIRQAFEYANAKVNEIAVAATSRRKSTRRAIFWELAVDKLIELTIDDPGLHVVEHYDTVSFIFDDAILIRLKKADMSLQTSNYPTPTAELFDVHQYDLFGFTGLQRVEAIYIPNKFETEIIWSGVVAHQGDVELWHFEFVPPIAVPTAVLPAPVQPPPEDLAKVKDQTKDADQKKSESDDGNR
jgi:hypothetical protein